MTLRSPQRITSNPGQAVKVLVVDDSAFMRFTISQQLNAYPGITVVGAARDGQEALELIPNLNPDVITLDVEMPRLDGLSTLRSIMADYPRPVVMLSSLTQEGAAETIQALTMGAIDFIAKPAQKSNIQTVIAEAAEKILRAAGARVRIARPVGAPAEPPRADKKVRPRLSHEPVVVVGASTGGPRALLSVFSSVRGSLGAAWVIVQHMPAGFTRSLAERLDHVSQLRVKEAEPGDRLLAGQVLLAPGGFHMTFDGDGCVRLDQTPTVHGVRPAVDVTVNSLVKHTGRLTVSTILTGMGSDGRHGCMLVHAVGGKVIAEDESSCVVWGMPRSVIETGIVDEVAPLEHIPTAIEKAVRSLSVSNPKDRH